MPKKMTQDPWELNQDDASKMKDSTKGTGGTGTFCPKRNISIGTPCKVCETIQPLWDFPEGSKERKLASKKKATVSYFMNVVLPSDRDKSVVLEIGKNVGDYIIDSIYDPDKNWKMVAHPMTGKGFLTKIKKRKGDLGFNTYDPFRGDTCDWDVPEKVLKSLTDLGQGNIIKMITKGELVEGENFLRIQALKLDETLSFRICPAWDYKEGGKAILTPVFRHWGVTQAEVDGDVPLNISLDDDATDTTTTAAIAQEQPWNNTQSEPTSHDSCYGIIEPMTFFDDEDVDCKKCGDFAECGQLVAKRIAKSKLG